MPLISTNSNTQRPGTLCFWKKVGIQGAFVKNHWRGERKSWGMSHLVHKSVLLEEYLMKALSFYETAEDETRPLTALKPPVCIGTGWTTHGITLPHFKADISELSKLSGALGQTDDSRTSFYTTTSLIQSPWQQEKSTLTPHLATLMGKPPLLSTILVSHSGADGL